MLHKSLAGAICLLTATVATASTGPQVETLSFDVLLNDKPIGSHTFVIRDEPDRTVVRSQARFDVEVLFVPVYSYRHSNVEVWRDGCLRRIDSETDSNGDRYRINGELGDDGFRVATLSENRRYDDSCVMSFAYWNKRMLGQQKLLNAQTGELIDVDVSALGRRTLALPGGSVDTNAFRVTSADGEVDILLHYSRDGDRWLALESTLQNGRVMRYRPAGDTRMAALRNPDSSDSAAGREQ
jgi:hypothetical protein